MEKNLREAIQATRENPDQTQIGHHGEWLDRDDPFRDDESGYQIGEFIRWFLESREQGATREEALQQACDQFSQEFGPEYIKDYDANSGRDNALGSAP